MTNHDASASGLTPSDREISDFTSRQLHLNIANFQTTAILNFFWIARLGSARTSLWCGAIHLVCSGTAHPSLPQYQSEAKYQLANADD